MNQKSTDNRIGELANHYGLDPEFAKELLSKVIDRVVQITKRLSGNIR